MKSKTLLSELLYRYNKEAGQWGEQYSDPLKGWRVCPNSRWMLWIVNDTGSFDAVRGKQFVEWCVGRVKHIPAKGFMDADTVRTLIERPITFQRILIAEQSCINARLKFKEQLHEVVDKEWIKEEELACAEKIRSLWPNPFIKR